MSVRNAKRIEVSREGAFTFRNDRLDKILHELDARTSGAECYSDTSYFTTGVNEGLLEKISIYSDLARTKLSKDRVFGYTDGQITQIDDIYYNDDLSEDSRVTQTITRNSSGIIVSCDSVFSTTEDTGCP